VEADSAKALDIAARETRAAKLAHVATADLRAGWREEALAADLDPAALAGVLHRAAPPASDAVDAGQQARVAAALTERASTFGSRDAVQAIAADARRGLPAPDVLERTARTAGLQRGGPGGRRGARSGCHPPRRGDGRPGPDRRAPLVDAGDAGR
jgi:hypothetical protein